MESGKLSHARDVINQGLVGSPDSKRLRATRAILLYKLGQREQSFEAFEELYGPSAAHHNLAVLDVDAGTIDSAVKHAKLATQYQDCSSKAIELNDALQVRLASAAPSRVIR